MKQMNIVLLFVVAANLVVTRVKGTLQRDVLTYINVFRHLHAAGPLLVDEVIQKSAQNAATTFMKTKNKDNVPIYRYSANFCTFTGSGEILDRTCVVSWYVSMKYFVWCQPKAEGQSLPFVNMIWKASTKAGVGVAKDSGGTYYVVVYIAIQDANNVALNVQPVKVVMEASPKANCPPGYSRLETSCFKYETTGVTWDEALTRCARENATLASIRNAKEEEFVRDLQRKAGATVETWIGLHDTLHEGRFKWFDGLRFQQSVCVPVHANGGHLENCVAWSIEKPQGCWEDRRCNEKIPFTCRIPVEGKSTYRTEILFKKFRWRPNYSDKNSKAYRDLINGIKITFKEIFTRKSGKKKGGFRKVKVKGVRAISFKGRPAGLGIAVSVKFRSFNADPTLRFQKFLRDSEKLLSMDIDKPDKVQGKTGKAGNYCYNVCHHKNTCTATYQQPSTYGYYPGYPAPTPAPAPPPYSPQAYSLPYPESVQTVTATADPYPSTCPMSCSQYPTLDCYMQCNDECCDNREGKRKRKPNRLSALKDLQENFGKLDHFVEEVKKHEQQYNNETYVTDENAENVEENIETNIRKLGIGFKKQDQAKQFDNLDKLNDTNKTNNTLSNNFNRTEPTGFTWEDTSGYEQETSNTHDMIDDDQESSNSDEESSIEPANDSSTTKDKHYNKHYPEETKGSDQLEDDTGLVNDEETIPLTQESISMQDEEKAIDESNDNNNEPGETNSVRGDANSEASNNDDYEGDEEQAIDETNDDNIEPGDTDSALGDENSEASNKDDYEGQKSATFKDNWIDPSEELLNEEGIDDVGKFGRKRDKVLTTQGKKQ